MAGSGWGGGGGGGQSGCERRIEVFVKIQKKKLGWGREGEGSDFGGQGGCDPRIRKFWGKIHQKKNFRGGGRFGGGGQGGCE